MNYLKKTVSMEYKGTKIKVEYLNIITTIFLTFLGALLIDEHQYFLSLAVLMVAVLPYVHELGHYLMALHYGKEVSELNFIGPKAETKVEGNLTHEETRDIALSGELLTGLIFVIAGAAVFLWGWENQSGFIYLSAIIPSIWIGSWIHKDSDMMVALKAHHYHNNQKKGDTLHGEYEIGSH